MTLVRTVKLPSGSNLVKYADASHALTAFLSCHYGQKPRQMQQCTLLLARVVY